MNTQTRNDLAHLKTTKPDLLRQLTPYLAAKVLEDRISPKLQPFATKMLDTLVTHPDASVFDSATDPEERLDLQELGATYIELLADLVRETRESTDGLLTD